MAVDQRRYWIRCNQTRRKHAPSRFSASRGTPPPRSEVEAFWNSLSCDRAIAVLQSVPAFLLQTPGEAPAAPAQVARCRMLP